MEKICTFTGKFDGKYFHFGDDFGFSGKAEPKLDCSTTKLHHLPVEELRTKFAAIVFPVNIMLKHDAKIT